MLEKLITCPVCNHDQFEEHLQCKDHMVTRQEFTITRCINCDFLFTNPRPNFEELPKYYNSQEYISHTDKSNNLINLIYKVARVFTLKNKFKLLSSLTEGRSILDFGCGTGDLLKECKKNQWNVYGFEPDQQARTIAHKKINADIFSDLQQLQSLKDISVVTLWHVLEHVSELNETISQLKSTISNNGKMIVAVPNPDSYDANHYQQYWAAYDVPRHLYHFSQQSIKKLMTKHELKIINTLPMKLDSFYVSLLSEKYKSGSSNYAKSFINGCKSNYYAKLNNNNYSSLIYIVSK